MLLSLKDKTRFWSKIDKQGESPGACWLWNAYTVNGYGQFVFSGQVWYAHRLTWILEHGALPPHPLILCHRCNTRACSNPDHLYAGTQKQNRDDAVKIGRLKCMDPGSIEIIKNSPDLPIATLADMLGCSTSAVSAWRIKLKRASGQKVRYRLSDEDIQFIRDQPKMELYHVAAILGCSESTVVNYKRKIKNGML